MGYPFLARAFAFELRYVRTRHECFAPRAKQDENANLWIVFICAQRRLNGFPYLKRNRVPLFGLAKNDPDDFAELFGEDFVGHGLGPLGYVALCAFMASMSLSEYPISWRISAECWPARGGGNAIVLGVRLMMMG